MAVFWESNHALFIGYVTVGPACSCTLTTKSLSHIIVIPNIDSSHSSTPTILYNYLANDLNCLQGFYEAAQGIYEHVMNKHRFTQLLMEKVSDRNKQ